MNMMSGLEQLQSLMSSDNQAPIARTLGFTLVEVSDGRAVFAGEADERTYNPLGSLHGGYAATLLDSACGIATHSKLDPGQVYTTLELKVSYHRAMTADSGPVRAEGNIVAFGRRVAFAEASLTDASGRLMASATSTLLVIAP